MHDALGLGGGEEVKGRAVGPVAPIVGFGQRAGRNLQGLR